MPYQLRTQSGVYPNFRIESFFCITRHFRGFRQFLDHFASWYSPSTSQESPSPDGVQVNVPLPLMPFSLPLPPLNPQLPLTSTTALSLLVEVPRYHTKNLSPLSIVAT